jgi:hypothetical protein
MGWNWKTNQEKYKKTKKKAFKKTRTKLDTKTKWNKMSKDDIEKKINFKKHQKQNK